MFSPDDALAGDLEAAGTNGNDPLWRLPLWPQYRKLIDSKVADINNASESGFAGAITAALFLQTFVDEGVPWVHLDLFGWNPRTSRTAGWGRGLRPKSVIRGHLHAVQLVQPIRVVHGISLSRKRLLCLALTLYITQAFNILG